MTGQLDAAVGQEAGGLRFEQVQRGPEGEIWSVVARLRVPGLDASRRVWSDYADSFDELVAFFNGLAADWRGWQGERTYESSEHDLRLTAVHDGMSASWCTSRRPPGWTNGQRPGSCGLIPVKR